MMLLSANINLFDHSART